jgi:hypothetical protein
MAAAAATTADPGTRPTARLERRHSRNCCTSTWDPHGRRADSERVAVEENQSWQLGIREGPPLIYLTTPPKRRFGENRVITVTAVVQAFPIDAQTCLASHIG